MIDSNELIYVVKRLRQSRSTRAKALPKLGRISGVAWAMHVAETVHLEALAAAAEEWELEVELMKSDPEEEDADDVKCDFTRAELTASDILNEEPRTSKTSAFWNNVPGASEEFIAEEAWIEGFIDGALEVWNSVKDDLASA